MRTSLNIEQLRTFLAIAETGSFTQAAQEVNRTQSAVSMQMKRLEETIERPLFERHGRINHLAPDGVKLLEYARRILLINDQAIANFTEPKLKGLVRIGTPDDYAENFLPPILAIFSRTNPHVDIEIICEGSFALQDKIKRNELDLAVVTHGDCSKMGKIIRREKLYWITSPNHLTHQLDVLALAMGPVTCCWRLSATEILDKLDRPYNIAYSSSSATALVAAVLSGLAITVLPESAIRPEMRILTQEDGFPPLPECDIAILRATQKGKQANQEHIDALANHVIDKLSNLRLSPQPQHLPIAV